jgi:hypothetical protein
MKNLFLLLLLSIAIKANAQLTITISRTYPDNTGDRLHQTANAFCDSVGSTLKAEYPARIDDGSLSVALETKGNMLTLTYSATIVPADKETAHYYFDHRGALSANRISEFAKKDAKERADQQYRAFIPKFMSAYGNKHLMQSTGHTASTNCNGIVWVIYENFAALGK